MIDPPHPSPPSELERDGVGDPDRTATPAERSSIGSGDTLQLLEETLQVSKREVLAGTVRVSTTTESYEEIAEVSLDHNVVDVTRVPVGQTVEKAPVIRTEGDTTIVPVIEERFVIVKQLYLKEELHIRRRVETQITHIPVPLRRQTAIIEQVDAGGPVLPDAGLPQG